MSHDAGQQSVLLLWLTSSGTHLVYAARIPEDSEEERGLVYFKKYIKVSRTRQGTCSASHIS